MSYEKPPDTSGVPDRSTPTANRRPPSGPGLPSAGLERTKVNRLKRRHPAARKLGKLQQTTAIIQAAEMVLAGATLPEAAVATGVGVDSRPVRALVKEAREAFARRVGDYLDLHMAATRNAAADGDAKPAQWALERIAEEGVRVFDQPEVASAPKATAISIGFRIGGIPQPADQPVETTAVTVRELPPMESVPEEDLP